MARAAATLGIIGLRWPPRAPPNMLLFAVVTEWPVGVPLGQDTGADVQRLQHAHQRVVGRDAVLRNDAVEQLDGQAENTAVDTEELVGDKG